MTDFPVEYTEVTDMFVNHTSGMVRVEFLPIWSGENFTDHVLVSLAFIIRRDVRIGDTIQIFLLPEGLFVSGVIIEKRPLESVPFYI